MAKTTGWWLGHPSEKYESIGMIRNPIYGKIKNGNQTTNQTNMCFGDVKQIPGTFTIGLVLMISTANRHHPKTNIRQCLEEASTKVYKSQMEVDIGIVYDINIVSSIF